MPTLYLIIVGVQLLLALHMQWYLEGSTAAEQRCVSSLFAEPADWLSDMDPEPVFESLLLV